MGFWRKEIGVEAKKQLRLAVPMIFVSFFQFSLQLISVMFVGHLGELPLAATSLASSIANATGFFVLVGVSSALDTLCDQSFGAKQYHMLGIHMQRGMLVSLIATIPAAIIWMNLRPILVALHQDRMIAKEAQAMRLALYVQFSSACKRSWNGFSTQSLHNIPKFLRLAGPSTFMVCIQTWIFEIVVLLAGFLPNPKLENSVLSICLNTIGIVWMIPFGVSAAARSAFLDKFCFLDQTVINCTRLSNELGADNPKAAYLAVKVVFPMAITVGISEYAILLLIRNIWGYAFTNIPEVISNVGFLMPILAAMVFLDAIQTALSGIVKGCGRQKFGAFVNLGTYFVGVPLAVAFTFVLHMKDKVSSFNFSNS
ncbi:hypothetical protein L6164_013421 [Bauhinia variegata]|uniref:Uncharacterized protein n=1 Tax=Bauhinia variegata TaxID=167791 RepID=A0ACB9NDZ6_BAUVA|nr:hypothetical protein L6164_013421 [Bauhinia variegata]